MYALFYLCCKLYFFCSSLSAFFIYAIFFIYGFMLSFFAIFSIYGFMLSFSFILSFFPLSVLLFTVAPIIIYWDAAKANPKQSPIKIPIQLFSILTNTIHHKIVIINPNMAVIFLTFFIDIPPSFVTRNSKFSIRIDYLLTHLHKVSLNSV